ncbi:Putative aminotransferase [Cronobacter condimenti 1330]|uniref:cysteine-S-conjugate beta-lyase n=1 Tax=Cronobacter condimenti 1330 TaxID=1073999 RepID=K8ADJ8_9ENTR|nr:PatB family C-S lyase [Cronobacter condimenti]ALB63120.1 aspartate aminotransferase [Cronobacter condimenti 1330]CCJ73864.1 Putative aminotransferase [Cronobacter condimenti 1330]
MAFNFDEEINRRHSDSTKWNTYDESVLPMWVADTDFRSPACITDALTARVQHGVFGYGAHPHGLADAFVDWCERRYQWRVDPEWLVFMPGIVAGLNLSVRAFTAPDETTIAPTPIYPPFRKSAAFAGREQLNAPLHKRGQRLVLELDRLRANLTGREKLLMLCNPQNPGGTAYRRDELEAQLAFAQEHDLLVCSDEIHCDLILEPGVRHIPFASLSEDAARRSITLMSTSKTFNIAGLGASVAVIPDPTLRRRFSEARAGIVPAVDILALTAAEAAWRDGEPWLEEQLAYLRGNRDRLYAAISGLPGLEMVLPEATYLAWVDASGLGVDNPTRFFKRQGLGFSPGADFGDPQHVRINFGCTAAMLKRAITRLQQAVNAADVRA